MRPIDIQNMMSRTHEVEKVQRVSEDSSRLQQIAFATELLRLKARQSKQVKASEEVDGGKVHTGDHERRRVNGDGKQRHSEEGNPSKDGLDERPGGHSGEEGQDRGTSLEQGEARNRPEDLGGQTSDLRGRIIDAQA